MNRVTQLALDERDANAGRAREVQRLIARDRVSDGASTLIHAYPHCDQLSGRKRQLVNANSRSMGNSILDVFVRVRDSVSVYPFAFEFASAALPKDETRN